MVVVEDVIVLKLVWVPTSYVVAVDTGGVGALIFISNNQVGQCSERTVAVSEFRTVKVLVGVDACYAVTTM